MTSSLLPESLSLNDGTLHHAILRGFIDTLRPPTVAELAVKFGASESTIRHALHTLADHHGTVLQPKSDEIWVTHPFSSAPVTCVIEAEGRQWWANCPWCAFGAANLIGGSGTVTTTVGGLREQVDLRFKDQVLLDTDYVIHFPVPMTKVWDNVIYTCSVQLLFRNEKEVDEWCKVRGVPRGDVRPVQQIWPFAGEWYGRHLDKDWRKWTVPEAVSVFRRHGLDGPIWALPDVDGRF